MPINLDHTADIIESSNEVIDIADTGALVMPRGSSAQRPASPVDGMLRFNTGSGVFEYWWSGAWRTVQSSTTTDTTRIHDIDDSTWVDTDEVAETVTMGTNGATRAWLDPNGRLGLGTATPAAGLHVLRGAGEGLRVETAGTVDAATLVTTGTTATHLWLADGSSSSDREVAVASAGDALAIWAGGAMVASFENGPSLVIGGSGGGVGLEVRTTDGMVLPVGTTAQRPAGSNGMLRYNSDNDTVEAFIAGTWTVLATKDYVDAAAQGLSWKEAVRVKDTSPSDTSAYTYDPAADGTASALVWTGVTTAPTWDGITLSDGDRILITEASDARGNGIFVYDATAQGFRRAPDADNQPGAEIQGGSALFVQEGTTYADSGWVISSPQGSIVLGTDQIYFIQFTAAASLTASNGIIRVGNDFQLTGQASALHNFAGTGYLVRTGSATFAARSFQGTPNQVQILNADGTTGNTVISLADDPLLPGTGRVGVPVGTTTERPSTPTAGDLRFNSDVARLEFYDGTGWWQMGAGGDFVLRAGDTMLGALSIIPGTLAAPGLNFAGDTGTGIHQSAAGQLDLVAANVSYFSLDSGADQVVLRTSATPDALVVDGGGNIGFGTATPRWALEITGSDAMRLPTGGDAARPVTLAAGLLRFNTDRAVAEVYNGTQWVDLVSSIAAAPRYVQTFNSSTDWGSPSGGYYSLTIPATTHGRGTDPMVQVFTGGPPWSAVEPDTIEVDGGGDVTLRVTETPDGRFAGKVVII